MRQTLCKTVLRVVALYVNYANHSNKDVDETFYNSVLVYLKNERNNKESNIIGYLMNDPTYGSFNLFNKLSVKMLMVLIIQKSLTSRITPAENEFLNLLKQIVGDVKILENALDICEQQFSTDASTLVTSGQINEKLMVTVTDKPLQQERETDS